MKKRIRGTTPAIEQAAREMRCNPTPAEAALWKVLHGAEFHYWKFRRQHPMGRFIIDFYSPELRLCIEVDGKHHEYGEQWERDRERTQYLSIGGFTLLRFSNEEVLNDLPSVLRKIEAVLPARTAA